MQYRFLLASTAVALALAWQTPIASAQGQQQNPGWFVPNQAHPAAPAGPAHPAAAPPPAAVPSADGLPPAGPLDEQAQQQQQVQVQLPPAPEIPPVAKGAPPPAAIVAVLSLPDVLRVSTAYQQADKTFNERRKVLDEDRQKEEVALRDLQQALVNERAKLTPEQIRQREREVQDRFSQARYKFGERTRIIQESGQYVIAQINRTLGQIVQQVAVAHGVNVVLNAAQTLYITSDFDLTAQVAEVLNKVLPSVVIPPEGVSPVSMAPAKSEPGATTPASAITPAKPATPTKPPAPAKH